MGAEAPFDISRGDLELGAMWAAEDPGDLAASPFQLLPAGHYHALIQLFHNYEAGAPLGTLYAEIKDGATLARAEVLTADHDTGDWQRASLTFHNEQPAEVRIRFHKDSLSALASGAIHLTFGNPRSLQVIGHRCNLAQQIEQSLGRGANALLCDVGFHEGELVMAESEPWPDSVFSTPAAEWIARAQSLKNKWSFLYFDCKVETAQGDVYRLGRQLVDTLRAHEVDPARCRFAIPDAGGEELYRAIADGGYSASAIGMVALHGSPRGVSADAWARVANEHQLAFIGFCHPIWEMTTPLSLGYPGIRETVVTRDLGADFPEQVIAWCPPGKASMRKLLDLGVDALVVEREDELCEVLSESPYRDFYRRAATPEEATASSEPHGEK